MKRLRRVLDTIGDALLLAAILGGSAWLAAHAPGIF
jgi:hypothetical protein